MRISITSLRTLSLGRGLLPEFDSYPHRSLKLVKRLAASIADPRAVGAAARATTLTRLAMARGLEPRGRAVDGGCLTPQQSEADLWAGERCALKGRKSLATPHKPQQAT